MNDGPAEKVPASEPQLQQRGFEKTPLFTAINAARYQRQELIKDIETTEPKLLCYVAGVRAPIDRLDAVGFMDMLHNVRPGESIDLLLHTPGGDVDAADKLITLVRSAVGESGTLRVIIPDFAKSAGTLMALGAHTILMSDSSELGPIDPQVSSKDSNGNEFAHSVLLYLKAHEQARRDLKNAPNDVVARITFEKFDPTLVLKYQSIRDRARIFAENLLKRQGATFTKIAHDLMDINIYPSHSQMIGWEQARQIGLPIAYLPRTDPTWRKYWALYCHLRLAIDSERRIFESNYVSIVQ